MEVNEAAIFVPRSVTAVIIATATRLAMRPYSKAVTPLRSDFKLSRRAKQYVNMVSSFRYRCSGRGTVRVSYKRISSSWRPVAGETTGWLPVRNWLPISLFRDKQVNSSSYPIQAKGTIIFISLGD